LLGSSSKNRAGDWASQSRQCQALQLAAGKRVDPPFSQIQELEFRQSRLNNLNILLDHPIAMNVGADSDPAWLTPALCW
jgi:hypothetical protein